MLAERSWYFGYGNTVRVSADPYFDFISFTKIKRRPKKEPNKTKKAKKNQTTTRKAASAATVRMLRYSSAGKEVKDMP